MLKTDTMLGLDLGRDEYGGPNPLTDWLKERRAGVWSVIEKFNIQQLGVIHVGPERLTAVLLEKVGEDMLPIRAPAALERGMTQEEYDNFDRQVQNDHLTIVLDWQTCDRPLPT